jgi:hypothetical protein
MTYTCLIVCGNHVDFSHHVSDESVVSIDSGRGGVSQLRWPRSCMWVRSSLLEGNSRIALNQWLDVNLIEAFAVNSTTIRDSELQLNNLALASSASSLRRISLKFFGCSMTLTPAPLPLSFFAYHHLDVHRGRRQWARIVRSVFFFGATFPRLG